MNIQMIETDTDIGCINRLVNKLCCKARNDGLQKGIDEIDSLSKVVLSTVTKEWIVEEMRRRVDRLISQKVWID